MRSLFKSGILHPISSKFFFKLDPPPPQTMSVAPSEHDVSVHIGYFVQFLAKIILFIN